MLFPWIKRPGLIAVPHDSGGWVVKDPLTLQYAYLNDVEYTILNFLDGRVTLNRLLQRVREVDPREELSADDLGPFVRLLAGHQLIRQIGPGDSLRLSSSQVRPIWQRIVQPLFQILRVQVPLVNPSRFISLTLPVVSKLAHPLVLRILFLVVVAGISLVVLRFREMNAALPTLQEFLGPQNVVLMLLIFVSVKVLHEAGHAFAAKHFGAECNECGVMLMVLTPVLYTNVTDSWMLPRRQRMLVTVAGIAVELVIASVCTLLWWQASPGLVKSLLLNTMLLCSVNTILFNGNPLLRFDGYFLLADFLRIPNLAGRSAAAVQQVVLRLVTGQADESAGPPRTQTVLLLYGVCSMAYRMFLTFAILQLVWHVAAEWNMQVVGSLLTFIILAGFMAIPLLRFLSQLFRSEAMVDYDAKTWARIAAAALIVAVVMFVPLPQTVMAPAYVQPAAEPVYANLGGRLNPEANYGDVISKGETLAILHNSELQRTGLRLQARVAELDTQLDSLTRNSLTASSELIPTITKARNAATEQLLKFEVEAAKLQVVANTSGVFLPPPATAKEVRSDLTEFWSGTAVSVGNSGAWINRGTLLGYVGAKNDVELLACVSQNEVAYLRTGQRVRFLLSDGGASEFIGVVEDVATLESKHLPRNLAVAGLVNGRMTPDGVEPLEVTYLVNVCLDDFQEGLPPALYSVGRIRVTTDSTSLWHRVARYLRQTF